MGESPTVLGRWTTTVLRALDAHGHDGDSLAVRAGIDPGRLDVAGARIPLSASTTLWRLGVEATDDPCFGLTVAHFVRPSTLAGLGMGVVSSVRLRDALERSSRFSAIVLNPQPECWITEHEDRVEWRLSFQRYPAHPAPEAIEAIMGSLVLCGRFLLGRSFGPKEVFLCRDEPLENDEFRSFFGCPVHFSHAEYALVFDRRDVDRHIATGSSAVAAVADELAVRSMNELDLEASTSAQVRAILARWPWRDGAVSLDALAEELAVSRRTLQRRLRAEGASLRSLVDDALREHAHRLLVVEGVTVEQTADRLGYHDASSFRRAFRRWTGTTPSGYTTRQLASESDRAPVGDPNRNGPGSDTSWR